MSYQALYRRFRPDNFGDVRGQDPIVTTLKNQIQSDRIGHAYLFCGTRGTGKTTTAKIFAKAVNCEHPTENGPCNECETCRSINNQTSMNVIEIDAASNNRVDDIRQVIDEVQYAPSQGRYKVYIIDEVHMLSTSAFNALLKTLEEPPEYLIFILATTEVHKIPLTILSRCQRYDFKRISLETIANTLNGVLEKEGIEAEEKALRYIAKLADGALRDGLSLLEQCVSFYFGETLTYENVLKVLGAVDQEVYTELMKAILAGQVKDVIHVLDDVIATGKDLAQFTSEFVWYLRNLLLVKTSEDAAEMVDVSAENLKDLIEVAEQVEPAAILRFIRIFSELAGQMKYAAAKRVVLEVALIKLCCPEMEKDYDSLIQRIHKLELRLESGDFAVAKAPQKRETNARIEEDDTVLPTKILPEAVPEELQKVAKGWDTILNLVGAADRAMLRDAKLTVGNENRLLLVFSEGTAAQYFQAEDGEKKEELAGIISNQIGKQVIVDVKMVQSAGEQAEYPDILSMFHINGNVDIDFID